MVRLLWLSVIIVCIMSGNTLFANEQAADILYEKGISDMQAKKYQDAEKAFLMAVEIYAQHSKSYFKLGELYEITNKPQDAIKNYNTALTILTGKENLSADDMIFKRAIELALQKTDKLGTKYKAIKDDSINALLALAEEAKKEKRTDLLGKIYTDILYLDPQNTNALKGQKDLAAQLNPAEAVKPPPSMKDFHDIFNGKDLNAWKKEENDKWDVKNREISIVTQAGESAYLTYRDKVFDEKYSVYIKFKSKYDDEIGSLCGTGIFFGYTNLTKNFYCIRADESNVIITYCEPSQDAFGLVLNHQLVNKYPVENYNANDWNTLILQTKKQELTVYFNGTLICENTKLENKTSGKIGIMAGNGSICLKEIKLMEK